MRNELAGRRTVEVSEPLDVGEDTDASSSTAFERSDDAPDVPKQLHFVRSVWDTSWDTAARWPRRPDER